MLFLATSPCSEVSQCRDFTVRWRQCGFGIWTAEAWCRETKIAEFSGQSNEDVGGKARQACVLHAAGWIR